MDDQQAYYLLGAIASFASILFILSELIAASKCEQNSVTEFIMCRDCTTEET
jgi:hypothetical protein